MNNNYFHILLDLKESELQKDILEIISTMNLPNVCISFHASPGKGFFVPVPANLLLFNSASATFGLDHYQKKHFKLYPEASFIYIGEKFYYHNEYNVLEIPEESHMKYLTRCLMNLYLEFNRNRISNLVKDSLPQSNTAK